MKTFIVVINARTHEIESKQDFFYLPELAQDAALNFAESRFPGGNFHYRVWIVAEVRYAFILVQGKKKSGSLAAVASPGGEPSAVPSATDPSDTPT